MAVVTDGSCIRSDDEPVLPSDNRHFIFAVISGIASLAWYGDVGFAGNIPHIPKTDMRTVWQLPTLGGENLLRLGCRVTLREKSSGDKGVNWRLDGTKTGCQGATCTAGGGDRKRVLDLPAL